MIYFDSDMSKNTNMIVYFDWKMVIYICGNCRTQFMLPMEKSVTFTGACANEIIPSINRSFVYKAKKGRHVRILNNHLLVTVICESLQTGTENLDLLILNKLSCFLSPNDDRWIQVWQDKCRVL